MVSTINQICDDLNLLIHNQRSRQIVQQTVDLIIRLKKANEEWLREHKSLLIENQELNQRLAESLNNGADIAVCAEDLRKTHTGKLEERIRELEDILKLCDPNGERAHWKTQIDPLVKAVCDLHGYGAVMGAAARLWFREDPIGAYTCGPCAITIRRALSNV